VSLSGANHADQPSENHENSDHRAIYLPTVRGDMLIKVQNSGR
jgi:hypothetical protein